MDRRILVGVMTLLILLTVWLLLAPPAWLGAAP
jgi:hypothetical protein